MKQMKECSSLYSIEKWIMLITSLSHQRTQLNSRTSIYILIKINVPQNILILPFENSITFTNVCDHSKASKYILFFYSRLWISHIKNCKNFNVPKSKTMANTLQRHLWARKPNWDQIKHQCYPQKHWSCLRRFKFQLSQFVLWQPGKR